MGLKVGPCSQTIAIIQCMGDRVWGCCLVIFDLAGSNGLREYISKGDLSMAY